VVKMKHFKLLEKILNAGSSKKSEKLVGLNKDVLMTSKLTQEHSELRGGCIQLKKDKNGSKSQGKLRSN